MNISILSSIILFGLSLTAYHYIKGRTGRNISWMFLFVSLFSFFIFLEYKIEDLASVNYLASYNLAMHRVLLIQIFSGLAGFCILFSLYLFVTFALEFPPITKVKRSLKFIIQFLSIGICCTSIFGLDIQLVGEKIERSSTGFMFLHVLFYILTTLTGTFILFSKSIQHTSLLRKFQITYLPLGVILGLTVGGIFGYVFYDKPFMVSIAAFSPIFSAMVLISGFLFSRELFQYSFDYKGTLKECRKPIKNRAILKKLQQDFDIQISIYTQRDGNKFENFISSELVELPEEMLRKVKSPDQFFFIEDYDEIPNSLEFIFLTQEKAQGGMFYDYDPGLVLVLVQKFDRKILSKADFSFLDQLFSSLGRNTRSEFLFAGSNKSIQKESLSSFLQRKFHLTYTEARICAEISAGSSREKIQEILDIKATTMKSHFSSIYEKTLKDEMDGHHRDKMQKLTVFLNRIMNDRN
jgi:DNA-binding CsgD family transcriptional regulator